MGLFNRRSTANNMFVIYKPLFEAVGPTAFALGTGADAGETDLWRMSRENIRYVRSVEPKALGLDTALAHTILSLGTRELDPWATRTEDSWQNPRPNELETYPNDVKPATWWLTKYKNKFFSDGSLVSGNPVLGALLVNEFGRGSDLVALDQVIGHLLAALHGRELPSEKAGVEGFRGLHVACVYLEMRHQASSSCGASPLA